MCRKILSMILCCLMLFGAIPAGVFSAASVTETGICGPDVTYSLTDDGVLTISGTGEMFDYSVISPFDSLRDRISHVVIRSGVTSIGAGAFRNCSKLSGVSIPKSVVSVGDRAFAYCVALTEISIPDGVVSIGAETFDSCEKLRDIVIPDSVRSIGSGAFGYTAWDEAMPEGLIYAGKVAYRFKGVMQDGVQIVLKDGTNGIAGSAFFKCAGLKSVVIPDGLTDIGSGAFFGCSGLYDINIPDSVVSVGGNAFKDTSWFYAKPAGMVYAGKVAYKYKGSADNDKTISVSSGTKGIASNAFSDCGSLKSITIPKSVIRIGEEAFSGCDDLERITVDSGNPKYHSTDNCLIETGSKTLIRGCKTSVIPDDGSVTVIGAYAFSGCSGLTGLSVPRSIRLIGDNAFMNCNSLTGILIPEGVEAVGEFAFRNAGLKRAYLPSGVKAVRLHAFENCSSLKDVYFEGDEKQWQSIPVNAYEPFLVYNLNVCVARPAVHFGAVAAKVEYLSTKNDEKVLSRDQLFDFGCFGQSSRVFQSRLAQMSMAVAMNAFTYTKDGKVKGGDKYIRKLLVSLGCEENSIKTRKFDNNTDTKDTCAFAIAKKELTDDEYLIIVPVRGVGYGSDFKGEWLSNFRVYDSAYKGYSFGFKAAADRVFETLADYIENDNQLSPDNIKVWITGFSRAAAVSNLLAARLVDDTEIDPENIFAYTFATPATVMTTSKTGKEYGAERYCGIHNIVQAVDPVPRVPLQQWNYFRYGVTYTLPFRELSGDRYDYLKTRMLSAFGRIAEPAPSEYRLSPHQKEVLDHLTDYLARIIPSAQVYGTAGYQSLLVDNIMGGDGNWIGNLFAIMYGSDAARILEIIENFNGYSLLDQIGAVGEIISINGKILLTDGIPGPVRELLGIINEIAIDVSGKLVRINLDWDAARKEEKLNEYYQNDINYLLLTCFEDVFRDVGQSYLFYQHWPEVYCAWLSFADEEAVLTPMTDAVSYCRTAVKCPVDINVYSPQGELIGQIKDDIVNEEIENTVYCRSDVVTGEKEIWLPAGEYCRIEILPREAGTMDIVNEFYSGMQQIAKTDAYFDLELAEEVPWSVRMDWTSSASIVRENNNTVSADLITEEEITYTVVAEATEGGAVSGGKSYRVGETAQMGAASLEGYKFDGWYLAGKKVCDLPLYAFTVTGDVTLEARFIELERVPGDVNGDGDVLANDARIALRASAKLEVLNDAQTKAADVDGDGQVLANDARQILRFSAKLQSEFVRAA